MSNGTRPAVLLGDLFSGDGPHLDIADRFVAGRCIRCGELVPSGRSDGDERWWCPTCWNREIAARGAA